MNYTDSNYPKKFFIPRPFASGTGAAYTEIENTSSGNVNFEDGFPSQYSAPKANGGKFVSRGEMNAIGRMASQNEFYRACGCLNTFDPDLAMAIGGYPMYAVLQYREGTDVFNVISLKDNNMVDFTGSALTDAQIQAGISQGSVDGENWGFCNVETTRVKNVELLSLPTKLYGLTGDTETNGSLNPVGIFRAPRNGNATIVGDYNVFSSQNQACGVIVWNEFDTLASAQAWIPTSTNKGHAAFFMGNNNDIILNNASYGSGDIRPMSLTSGKYYSIFVGTRQLRIQSGGSEENLNSPIFTDVTLRIELQAAV